MTGKGQSIDSNSMSGSGKTAINGATSGTVSSAFSAVNGAIGGAELLRVLASDFRQQRTMLLEAWRQRLVESIPFGSRSPERSAIDPEALFDSYLSVLETGSVEALDSYAQRLAERTDRRQINAADLLMVLLLLRDVLSRSLAVRFHQAPSQLASVLDAFEPAANRISRTLAFSVVEEHERVIREQQSAIRQLSTPVLQVRERLLIHPIIGIVDTDRARLLTEQLLHSVRANRAKVVVVDITGVPSVDATVASHLVQSVEAARLLGATVIISGVSPDIARTLVTIGTDLSALHAVGDLQGGIEEAEAILGLELVPRPDARAKSMAK